MLDSRLPVNMRPRTDRQIERNTARPSLRQLMDAVAGCMLRDRHFLSSGLRRVAQMLKEGRPADRLFNRLADQIHASRRRVQQRLAALPRPTYAQDLPVVAEKELIARTISGNQVVVPLRRNRLRQDHAASQDLPGTWPRRGRPHRPHAAAPDRGAIGRDAHLAGTRLAAWPNGRL